MVSAMPKIEQDVHTWSVDLSMQWPGVVLPRVHFELRTTANGYREGRCAELRGSLTHSQWMNLQHPVLLTTHREPKPWGAEVWYTGIEKRGVCGVTSRSGVQLSLPEYLTLLAGEGGGIETPPLLKILDPFADPERGSLYLEVHEEKWETYIVTCVSEKLYPTGAGEVLFGFSQEKLSSFHGNERAFRDALLAEVRSYEILRRKLDGESSFDENGRSVYAQQADVAWKKVRSFFGSRRVRVGDVIAVPPFMPHSLQAGVRVVEFQTPTYERLILAFNQKVLTQSHWDSERAIEMSRLTLEPSAIQENASHWQRIVHFPQFSVFRCDLPGGREFELPDSTSSVPATVFVISGEIEICTRAEGQLLRVSTEQAALLPRAQQAFTIRSISQRPASVLCV